MFIASEISLQPPTSHAVSLASSVSGSKHGLPADLLQDISRRLAFISIVVVVVSISNMVVAELTQTVGPRAIRYSMLVLVVGVSAVVLHLSRSVRVAPARLLDVGLGYEIVVALTASQSIMSEFSIRHTRHSFAETRRDHHGLPQERSRQTSAERPCGCPRCSRRSKRRNRGPRSKQPIGGRNIQNGRLENDSYSHEEGSDGDRPAGRPSHRRPRADGRLHHYRHGGRQKHRQSVAIRRRGVTGPQVVVTQRSKRSVHPNRARGWSGSLCRIAPRLQLRRPQRSFDGAHGVPGRDDTRGCVSPGRTGSDCWPSARSSIRPTDRGCHRGTGTYGATSRNRRSRAL